MILMSGRKYHDEQLNALSLQSVGCKLMFSRPRRWRCLGSLMRV